MMLLGELLFPSKLRTPSSPYVMYKFRKEIFPPTFLSSLLHYLLYFQYVNKEEISEDNNLLVLIPCRMTRIVTPQGLIHQKS